MAPPRIIQSFAPMSDYERQVAEARRREALAEALESQAYRPLQGDAAPIPSAAPLVMALQGFMSARQRRKAEEAGERAKTAEMEEFETLRKSLEPQERVAQPDMFASPDEMASKYTAPRMETYTPSQEERTKVLERAYFGGSPRAAKYAEYLLTKKSPEAEEFYAPVTGAGGKFVQFGKRGGVKESTVAALSETKSSDLARLIAERDALKPDDPNRKIYDAAIAKETTRAAGPVTNVYSGSAIAGVDDEGNPIYAQLSRTGGEPSIVKGIRPAPKGMNVDQAKAAGFADRIAESTPILDVAPPSMGAMVLSDLPGGNFALDPQQQSFFQAERNFINAVLRRESGAVISDPEFANARKQYIPQPGDSKQVLEQKRRNRETVLRSISRDAGPLYQPTNVPLNQLPEGFELE